MPDALPAWIDKWLILDRAGTFVRLAQNSGHLEALLRQAPPAVLVVNLRKASEMREEREGGR
jgi:hypothetical protein